MKRKKIKVRKSLRQKRPGSFQECPYYKPEICPKTTPIKNLEWRIRLLEAALHDKGLQRDLKQIAFDDVLWWFNALCFCFEPRGLLKVRPFCTWPHQDRCIVAMDNAISESEQSEAPIDLVVDKSRGQGATWMYLMVFLRRWLRDELFSAGLVTRNEKLVDSLRDPDTLMWKVVWMLKMLPTWMLPDGFDMARCRNLTEHSLMNPENGATIVGYSATGDVARGGRKSVFAMDELAAFKPGEDYAAMNSTAHVTNCRFLVSTFLGDSGAYYDAATQDNNAVKIVLDWKENPTQNKKLYRLVGNTVFEVDRTPRGILSAYERGVIKTQHTQLRRRGFKVENKIRNVWYNNQCLRPGSTPHGIAQELDRDPRGSVSKVFDGSILQRVKETYCTFPVVQGRLVYDTETAKVRKPCVVQSDDGELKLWVLPNVDGMIAESLYVVGCDISAGTAGSYSSNSVACVVNRMTGEQVAEWVSNSMSPAKFAYLTVALCRWFHNATLIPEANFSASYMKVVVEDIGYENVYMRKVDIVGIHRQTQKPGFWMTNDDARLKLFESLQEAMADGAFVPRSKELIDEMPEYEWRNGRIVHVSSSRSVDDSAKGKAHGDRVIAAALAWLGCDEEPVFQDSEETPVVIPKGSMAERLQRYDDENARSGDPWETSEVDIFAKGGLVSTDEWG